jgi:glycosyltransferase involved in cell wall biosynthesis
MMERREISVVLLAPELTAVSGVSTHLRQILGSSLRESFELDHFCVGSEGRSETVFDKWLRFLISPLMLAGYLIRRRPSIVHVNTSMDHKAFWRDAVYLMLVKLLCKRVVYQVHGGELPETFFGRRGVRKRLGRWVLRRPDAVVLLADLERDAYQAFDAYKLVRVIPNAIDLVPYQNLNRKRFDGKILRLGYIGRLIESKGIFEIADALAILRRQGIDDWHFSVAGSGPDESAFYERVKKLGLTDQVTFLGPVFGDDKIKFWRELDIFVFPTAHEGLPYTILESLASGTPMITTQVGGIPEAIVDGLHGRFVEPGDVQMLAETIKAMMVDRDSLREMSVACVNRAREQYGVDRLVDQLSALYSAVMG